MPEHWQALLGDPAMKEVQAPANVWAYNGTGCVLNIFFYPYMGGDSYKALTYEVKVSEASDELERQCFQELLEDHEKLGLN